MKFVPELKSQFISGQNDNQAKYEGHLESSGNSGISQSPKKSKTLYILHIAVKVYMTIHSIYFVSSVQSYRTLYRYTVCILKFSTFSNVLILKKYLFYPD